MRDQACDAAVDSTAMCVFVCIHAQGEEKREGDEEPAHAAISRRPADREERER